MKKWYIYLRDATAYPIEAKTKEEAIEKALDFWIEREPDIYAEEIKED